MKMHRLLLISLVCSLSLSVSAQWQWVDKSGRKVFSDQPPAGDIPDSSILKRPAPPDTRAPARNTGGGPGSNTAAPQAGIAGRPVAPASQARSASQDPELEKKKAQAEAQEAAKKREEEQKLTTARAENCERARRSLASLQAGVRIAQTSASGEREFLTDEARTTETQRAQGIVNSECQPR
ncbi:MAG: hypothetical protein RLZZ401_1612 [Pseudomonadota bacterium]|jgi:hypothetical protein